MTDLFITGTDTNVGKTVLSALLVAALDRHYWKPIQTGASEDSDRRTVIQLAGIPADRAYPETYVFDPPVSPHLAAERAGVEIDLDPIQRPVSATPLIIEGAGGILVPINSRSLMLDLARHLGAPLVIATRTTLGTINHTLLTVSAIRNAKLKLNGVVMIGDENADNRRAIERYGNVPVIGWIPRLEHVDREVLRTVFQRHFNSRAFE